MTTRSRSQETGSLADLTPDPKNVRKHNPRNIDIIGDGIQKVGFSRSIVVDENGDILVGNGAVEAAIAVGLEKVRFVEADGEEVIAVVRRGLTDEQKKLLSLYDNRSSDLSEWDRLELERLATENPELLQSLWFDEELERDLARLSRRDQMYEASTTPEIGDGIVSANDVESAAARLANLLHSDPVYKVIMCPHCLQEIRLLDEH